MDYVAPESLKEALAILRKPRSGARIVAGGTDVLPRVTSGKERPPKRLVSLAKVPGLDKVTQERNGDLRIGARVSLAEVVASKKVARYSQALREAVSWIGSEQIRTTATLVGNLCSASSAADTLPPLLCADAVVEVAGGRAKRRLTVAELLKGPRKLSLKAGEMVLAVRLPKPKGKIASVYLRHGPRRAMDCAIVIGAAQMSVRREMMKDVRLALGAVHATAVRCPEAERLLSGQAPTDALLSEAAEAVVSSVTPQDDIRATARHRLEIVRRIVPQILLEAFARAGGKR